MTHAIRVRVSGMVVSGGLNRMVSPFAMIESVVPPLPTPLEVTMAKPQPMSPPTTEARPSRETVKAAAQALLNERKKKSQIPDRIRGYLDDLKEDGLDVLVQNQVPIKSIMEGFVRKFGWKISPAHLKIYLAEEYNYTSSVPAKKSAKTKKVAKQTRA
ncbi:MAG: hypothetical protein WKF61_00430 [Luteimonas sp.]